jgi:hypothetical protein
LISFFLSLFFFVFFPLGLWSYCFCVSTLCGRVLEEQEGQRGWGSVELPRWAVAAAVGYSRQVTMRLTRVVSGSGSGSRSHPSTVGRGDIGYRHGGRARKSCASVNHHDMGGPSVGDVSSRRRADCAVRVAAGCASVLLSQNRSRGVDGDAD